MQRPTLQRLETCKPAIDAYRLPETHGTGVAAQEGYNVRQFPSFDEASKGCAIQHRLRFHWITPHIQPHVAPRDCRSNVVHLGAVQEGAHHYIPFHMVKCKSIWACA